jgi:hypothetical protein
MINQSLRVAALATAATLLVPLLGATLAAVPAQALGGDGGGLGPDVFPSLKHGLVAYYDFDHPVPGAPGKERDRGLSGTDIDLVNGGAAMRVPDRAHRRSGNAAQFGQVDPAADGNDDWKAGVFSATGVPSLHAYNAAGGATIMGWFKMTGTNPSPNTTTPDPADRYNAIGLAGVLTGDSQGHDVRALLELINVNGELRLVALGRRVDGGSSQTFAANQDWRTLLPPDTWVHLAATFDFDDGTMALYRNGMSLPGFYTIAGDPWRLDGPPEPDVSTASDPAGIKIGGSFPQNTLERNPCDCRMDTLLFLDRPATPAEVRHQHRR